jgi:ABC-type bacteriocin/lantibiotic exporter with double-glycine peptidase domain
MYYVLLNCFRSSKRLQAQEGKIIRLNEDINVNLVPILTMEKQDEEYRGINSVIEETRKRHAVFRKEDVLSYCSLMIPYTIVMFLILARVWHGGNKKMFMKLLLVYVIFLCETTYLIINSFTELAQSLGIIGEVKQEIESYIENIVKKDHKKTVSEELNEFVKEKDAVYAHKLNFKHNKIEHVLKDCTIGFTRSEYTAVVGGIGSGKTTLLRCIFGMLNYEGYIYRNGKNLNEVQNLIEWRKDIHYCNQSPTVFHRDYSDNIFYGSTMSKRQARDILQKLGLYDFVRERLRENSSQLSGGQKQLTNLIRIILNQKPIVLLDEPTASLDSQTRVKVYNLIRYLKKEDRVTVIIATHDPELIQMADRIITLSSGVVISDKQNDVKQ